MTTQTNNTKQEPTPQKKKNSGNLPLILAFLSLGMIYFSVFTESDRKYATAEEAAELPSKTTSATVGFGGIATFAAALLLSEKRKKER